jgi:outer membrane cobalamin receptor
MLRVASLLSVLLLVPAPARAEGGVAGTLRTKDGTALPQVVLAFHGLSGDRSVVTGPGGRFHVTGLRPGDYALVVSVPGVALSSEHVSVTDGEQRVDLVLEPAAISERVVVAATRGDAALSTLGIAASALDRSEIQARQAPSFLDLVRELPGVSAARTGGVGSQGSAFVRGGESRYARVLVDGVPVNQPGGAFDFGSALPLELERVEIVRGAASSLYGSDALGGVIQLVTRRADATGAPELRAEAEGGAFAWRRYAFGTSGRASRLDWNLGLERLMTDNRQPNNAFDESAGAASLGVALGDRTDARLVLRGEDSTLGTPGQTAFGRPDLDASFGRTDWTLGLDLRHARARVSHLLRVGLATSDQLSRDPLDSGSFTPRAGDRAGASSVSDFTNPLGFQNDTTRLSAGYQAEAQITHSQLLTAGLDLERETGALGSRADAALLSPSRTNVGAYLQDRVVVGMRVYLTLGGRIERNASFGTRAVPRAAVAVRVRGGEDATTLRASAGAGIKEPDFFQSFGASFFARGNPDLKPERSRSFDFGLEQRLLRGRLRAEATLFHQEYRDQIAFETIDFTTFQGSYVNLGHTRARGVELAAEAAPNDHLALSANYTFLDGEILVSANAFDPVYAEGRSLLRRPRHQGTLAANGRLGRVSFGATLLLVGRRADSDFLGLGLTENPAYARLDARVRGDLGHGLQAFLVAENLLDRQYQEALGYPALGRALHGGLRYTTRR